MKKLFRNEKANMMIITPIIIISFLVIADSVIFSHRFAEDLYPTEAEYDKIDDPANDSSFWSSIPFIGGVFDMGTAVMKYISGSLGFIGRIITFQSYVLEELGFLGGIVKGILIFTLIIGIIRILPFTGG